MKYAVVFSSRTGNTELLARAIREVLPEQECVYFGTPDPTALAADTIYAGFWTDKGTCDEATAAFLRTLEGKRVFLFGTAGFGGDSAYFDKILTAAGKNLPDTAIKIGQFMCQGKMPAAVRRRYEAMEESPRRQLMLENFDRAVSHPDAQDLKRARTAAAQAQ